MPQCQRVRNHILGVIRILIFIDQHILKPILQLAQNLRMIPERLGGFQQQIVKIQGAVGRQQLLIFCIDAGDGLGEKVPGALRIKVRRHQFILGIADGRMNGARREIRAGDIQHLQRIFNELRLIAAVKNGEVRRQMDQRRVVPKHPQAQRMEGADRRPSLVELAEIVQRAAQNLAHPLLHLPRRLVRKRDRQDRMRRNAQADEVDHPAGDDARFTAAGPGDDEQRPIHMHRRFALLGSQIFQQLFWINHRRTIAGQSRREYRTRRHGKNSQAEGGSRRRRPGFPRTRK